MTAPLTRLARMTAAAALALSLTATAAPAALVGHWTLDDLSAGIQNSGSAANSDLTAGGDPTATAGIIGGGALAFDGSGDMLSVTTAGNAADSLAGYPFTMSGWFRAAAAPGNRGTVFSVSDLSQADRYYAGGLFSNGTNFVVTRNPSFDANPFDAAGPNTSDGVWHQLTAVYNGTGDIQMWVDGTLIAVDTSAQTFDALVDTLSIGGVRRSNGSTSSPTDPMVGDLDDVALHDTSRTREEIALTHLRGRNGLDAASTRPGVTWYSDFDGVNDDALIIPVSGNSAMIVGGELELTPQADNQTGTVYVPDLTPGERAGSIHASFLLQSGPSDDSNPADGVSFFFGEFANNTAVFNEDFNLDDGLRILFGLEEGGGEAIRVFYSEDGVQSELGQLVTEVSLNAFTLAQITVNDDGELLLYYGNQRLELTIDDWAPQEGWQFAFSGRTGGRNALQHIDNLQLSVLVAVPTPAAAAPIALGLLGLATRRRSTGLTASRRR